ncbi:MAG: ABC transporter ATP-binding protein [Anaerolineaceae bacterium]|nr:ABC transporter ATP-binding protein [Anaerolineaceae bacterium]
MENKIFGPEVIKMVDISKVYPNGVIANKGVNLVLHEGEIHALIGENGAGKSTLMKILFGIEQPTEGKIFIRGKETRIKNPMHAIDLGIGMVHQHFMLDEKLSVTENIILGMEPKKGLALDYQKADQMVQEISDKYRFHLNPKAIVADLDVGKKQKVEILKALIRGAKILIMDEPTAVLTPQETAELFEQLKMLRANGHTIVFISHKLNEVKAICERATILRGGRTVGMHSLSGVSITELSRLMIGRDLVMAIEKAEQKKGQRVLSVQNLIFVNDEFKETLKNVSFNVYRGEILGIAGVEGNGQRELIDCITGLAVQNSGKIEVNGRLAEFSFAALDRREKGMTHIPEDRLTYGCMMDGSIQENIISSRYRRSDFNKALLLDFKKINSLCDQLIQDYEVKTDSKFTPIRMLSGGNIQKVVAAREMSEEMDILIADQPTRGIDVGTAALIHNKLVQKRDSGAGILVVSADINEVLELSDSLIVFFDGKISAYFKDASSVTEEELGLYMLGLKQMSEKEIMEVAA